MAQDVGAAWCIPGAPTPGAPTPGAAEAPPPTLFHLRGARCRAEPCGRDPCPNPAERWRPPRSSRKSPMTARRHEGPRALTLVAASPRPSRGPFGWRGFCPPTSRRVAPAELARRSCAERTGAAFANGSLAGTRGSPCPSLGGAGFDCRSSPGFGCSGDRGRDARARTAHPRRGDAGRHCSGTIRSVKLGQVRAGCLRGSRQACAQLQGELAVCQAEHASQIHAIRLEAEAHLRTDEVEAERRHQLAWADRRLSKGHRGPRRPLSPGH